jgi:hypothetical protein
MAIESMAYTEIVFLAFLSLLGMLVGGLARASSSVVFIALASYAVGLAVLQLMGILYLMIGVPLSLTSIMGSLLAITLLLGLFHLYRSTFNRRDAVVLAIILCGFTLTALALSYRDFMVSSNDSLAVQRLGEILAYTGTIDEHFEVLGERGIFVALMQAVASMLGLPYCAVLYPCLMFPMLTCFVYFGRTILLDAGLASGQATLFSILGAACLATSPFTVWNAYYLNTHLASALYLLLCLGSITIASLKQDGRWLLFAALSCITLSLLRHESIILATAILLFFLPVTDCSHRAKVWFAVCVTAVAIPWYGYLYALFAPGKFLNEKLFVILGGLVAASLLICMSRRDYVSVFLNRLPGIVVVTGILVLMIMFSARPEHMMKSLNSIISNLFEGHGYWGKEWFFVVPMLLLALVFPSESALRKPLLYFIASYFLLMLMLVYFRGAYRVSHWDSANRMLIHIFPVTLLYLTVQLSTGLYGNSQAGMKS